ncbi:MAG: hypothetical protein ACXVKI_16180 [Flavisolibacter sp.]
MAPPDNCQYPLRHAAYLCPFFMGKYISVILLLFAFAAQNFQQAFIVMDYYSHKAAYAQYCENKARPMLHCNGKCQMMKRLKEQEKKEQQDPERRPDHKNELVYDQSHLAQWLLPPCFSSRCFACLPPASLSPGVHPGIFHPPGKV